MVTEDFEFVAARRVLDAFNRHLKAREVDQLVAACYADDALVLPPNLPFVEGRGQIREFFREMIEAEAGDVLRETTVFYVAGDLGYGAGRSSVAIGRQEKDMVPQIGKYLLVYRRQADGTWKIAVDMFSSNLPVR